MSPEFTAFLMANGTVLVIVLGFLAVVGIVQWRKARAAEQELELKQTMLEKGIPIAEIERLFPPKAPGAPARRGLIEQFASLSGGAKTGIIVGGSIVLIVLFSGLSAAVHSYAFWSSVRQQQTSGQSQVVPPPVEPSDPVPGHVFFLDLHPVTNQKLTDVVGENGHSLAAIPQKRREFGGIPFQVGPGYVRLRGKNRPELPAEVIGVRVGMNFDKLHIFHGTEYGAFGDANHKFHVADGTEIARYRVRYADASEEIIPIVYGHDVRDAWNWDRSKPVTRGRVVWTGTSPGASKEGVSLRLYLTTWTNPKPEVSVTAIDITSAGTSAASPFCVALTVERAVK